MDNEQTKGRESQHYNNWSNYFTGKTREQIGAESTLVKSLFPEGVTKKSNLIIFLFFSFLSKNIVLN